MTVYRLPTRSPIKYRGKYPTRIRMWGYGSVRSPDQRFVAEYLEIVRPVHIEINDGSRYIADLRVLNPGAQVNMEFALVYPGVVTDLSQERYDEMLTEIRRLRAIR